MNLKNVTWFDSYLVGVGRGILWANTILDITGQKKLFCTPENLAMDEGIILSVIDQELRN